MKHQVKKSGRELGRFLERRAKPALVMLLMLLVLSLGWSMGFNGLLQSAKHAGLKVLWIAQQHYPTEEVFVAIVDGLQEATGD